MRAMHRVLTGGMILLCVTGAGAAATPAMAGGYGGYGDDRDGGCRTYCDTGGYRDYDRDDGRYGDYDDRYRSDDGYYRRYRGDYYPSRYYDGYRERHYVCDPDGDRCYRSRGWYWNYREYYRRHGYRWEN